MIDVDLKQRLNSASKSLGMSSSSLIRTAIYEMLNALDAKFNESDVTKEN